MAAFGMCRQFKTGRMQTDARRVSTLIFILKLEYFCPELRLSITVQEMPKNNLQKAIRIKQFHLFICLKFEFKICVLIKNASSYSFSSTRLSL